MIKKSKSSDDIAVFTTKFVLEDRNLITYVTHELEDGAWQFFSDDKFEDFNSVAKIVGLNEIIGIDPSLTELLKMEVGHFATRKNKTDVWIIKKSNK